jgi:hypothetical protein
MKKNKILSIILIAAAALITGSCGSGKTYSYSTAPRSRTYVSLIITPFPGFTMNHDPDGRYYHRSPQGFIYWKGYDNRFFLDKKHVSRVNYNKWEYNEWKRWYEQQNRYNNRRHSY